MRLLYADTHVHSLNPTNTLMPHLVASAAPSLTLYGPGFSSPDDLVRGILKFVERTGPYDGIVLGPNSLLWSWAADHVDRSARSTKRYTALSSAPERIAAYNRDIMNSLPDLPVKWRIASLLTLDSYAAAPRVTERLESLDLHIIAPDAQFSPLPEQLPDWVWMERHFIRKKKLVSGAWREFLERNAHRIISLPHFVGDNEFFYRGLAERSIRISAPGVGYVMRQRGVEALKSRGIAVRRKHVFNLFRALDKLGIQAFSNFVALRLFNVTYLSDLVGSRFVYTAPEGFHIPVRKFFEIPAAGAALLCLPPWSFSSLGFRDGEHYVNVTPESLPDALLELEKNPDRAQAIADAGRRLVLRKHSASARISQLSQCLKAIGNGTFKGSRWDNGEFRLIGAEAAADARDEAQTVV